MIPEEKTAAVTRGLREAFGVEQYEDIRLLAKSATALVYRIVVQGTPYLLRIITRIGESSCQGHFIAMRAAAEAGLAPKVWYTSLPDRVCITDFVAAVPFSQQEALVRMPAVLHGLHALPPFPAREPHLNTSCTFLLFAGEAKTELIRSFEKTELLSVQDKAELLARYAELAGIYPQDGDEVVSSHNDLVKPDNFLFDGNRVWVVDWEAATPNDRYADLAVVANFVTNSEPEEKAFLEGYFGRPAEPYELARLFLMRQIAHIFYTMAYLLLSSSGNPVSGEEAVPGFQEFHHRIWAGEVDFKDPKMKLAYGKVHWNQLQGNVQTPRYAEALRIVADRHRSR